MHLCKCLNCFLKTHNKQLNQYCLNFIIFLAKKKNVLKNGLGHELSFWSSRVTGQLVFALDKKNSSSGRVRKF